MTPQRVYVALIGLGVFVGVQWLLERGLRQAPTLPPLQSRPVEVPPGQTPPIIQVTRFLDCIRQLKLFTVEIRGQATATITDECWRGVASATVTAPVRYQYGVDLDELADRSIAYSAASDTWIIKLPPPRRLATEIGPAGARESLEIRGLRWRSRAGEAVLRRAREAARLEAHTAALTESMRRQVYDQTRLQVAQAVSRLAADGRKVSVQLSSEPPSGATLATSMDR